VEAVVHRLRRGALLCLPLLAAGQASPAPAAEPHPIEASIVRIVNHSQRGNWFAPWDAFRARQSSGSGFVVAGGLIITNAHVVSDARLLLVYLGADPTPHPARVRFIAHDCDLALLEAEEPGLLDGIPPLAFDGLPRLGSSVETYGYPAGGQRISSTRGVVSRIEVHIYSHSALDNHLTVQTDAAINPGNSGGPVIQDGRAVGVAFQAAAGLENVGFFIPTEVVEHFLEDVADGRYDGYPELGAFVSTLESPAARRRAGLGPGESGVRVDLVMPGASADGHLRVGDVVLAVDGRAIANDGTVARDGVRLSYGALLDVHQTGERVRLSVLREGERLELEVPMQPYAPMRRFANRYDEAPRYYVYAGFVFVPLERETLETFGEAWSSQAEKHLLYEYFTRFLHEPERIQREPVLLLRRLDHEINANAPWNRNLVVSRVNGREIRGLVDVIEAIESNRARHHLLEFEYFGRFIALDRAAADRAHGEILERYGVPRDRRL
jgi:S1-C subfamily serine protease